MLGNDREGLGVPWPHVVSLNEVYSNLQMDFGRMGS